MVKKEDAAYEQWLKDSGKENSKLNKEWFYCPEEKRAEFIKKHKTWWENFCSLLQSFLSLTKAVNKFISFKDKLYVFLYFSGLDRNSSSSLVFSSR